MGVTPMPIVAPQWFLDLPDEVIERLELGLIVHPPRGHGWRDMLGLVCLVRGHDWQPFVKGASRCSLCHHGRMPERAA